MRPSLWLSKALLLGEERRYLPAAIFTPIQGRPSPIYFGRVWAACRQASKILASASSEQLSSGCILCIAVCPCRRDCDDPCPIELLAPLHGFIEEVKAALAFVEGCPGA